MNELVKVLEALRAKFPPDEFGRMRAILCGENILLHRGETIMTVTARFAKLAADILDVEGCKLLMSSDVTDNQWIEAFEQLDRGAL